MSLTVKYIDAPPGAQENAIANFPSAQPFGKAENLVSGVADKPYATLEPSGWPLDGSRVLFDDSPKNVGWWSKERTDDNGRFSKPPVISLSLSQPFTATGITIVFWPSLGQWCNDIKVTWYNGETLMEQITQAPDSATWVVEKAVEGFDRVEIELLGTNVPGQFAKVQQIQIGHMVIFVQDEISRVSLLNEIDPSLCELSTDTMKVEIIENKSRELIPQENQAMYLYRDGKQIASQYITDSSREGPNFYTFNCQSAIGRLEDVFLGGIYNDHYVRTILRDILEGFKADWSAFEYATVTGYLPVCTKREALQQIAFAIGAVVTTQGDGAIRLIPLSDAVEAEFTGENTFIGANVSREAQTATVQVASHSYKALYNDNETLLDEEPVNGYDVLYVFSDPHHMYSITGGTIESSGHNWARITAFGPVTLTAQKYLHSTSIKKMENQYATAAEKGNILSVENATLVHSGNVDEILERLYNFSTLKNVLTQDVVVTEQRAGQIARSETPWNSHIVGYITSMENEFTNTGHTAGITIRGKEEKNAVNYRQNKG